MRYRKLADCGIGACPAIYEEDCGPAGCPGIHQGGNETLLIVGKKVGLPPELRGRVGSAEAAVEIPRSVFLQAAQKLGR